MKFSFFAAKKASYLVSVLCDVLSVSHSGFYAHCTPKASRRKADDIRLATEIAAIHRRSRNTFGSPRIHAELRAGKGMCLDRKRVGRLMRERAIQARQKRRFRCTTNSKHMVVWIITWMLVWRREVSTESAEDHFGGSDGCVRG